MLNVKLAGYNVDADVLNEFISKDSARKDVTPEILSAAYARISRDPRSVDELRKSARTEVEKARKSNQQIIFQMGHHSVAEHAVFNFDVMGISRYAMEELEKFRLCSFTEKSQRYITLQDAFVVPDEIKKTHYESQCKALVKKQFALYETLFQQLKSFVFEQNPALAEDPKKHALLEGWAKEDARYITPLATEAQLGLTVNARNLELMMRRFASHPLNEIQMLGRELYRLIEHIAPSIILFHQANDFDRKTYQELQEFVKNIISYESDASLCAVELSAYTLHADEIIASALLHTVTNSSFKKVYSTVEKADVKTKKEIFKQALKYLEFYDTLPREFEFADLTYNLIISSACFGQMKRHRMATITSQPYNPALGIVIPESIKLIGYEAQFRDMVRETETLYKNVREEIPLAAPYLLTNSHRKRLLMNVNARELYHISRLREDAHAQWEIRQISAQMSALAKEVMPLTMMLIGGKDVYAEIYKEVYGHSPKILPPEETIKNKAEVV